VDTSLALEFPGVAGLAGSLATSRAVTDRWDDEISCAGMTVGGLAHHLAAQAGNTARLLSSPPDVGQPIPVLEHYRRAAWVRSGHDEQANVEIRAAADREARGGPAALAEQVRRDLAALPDALAPVLAGARDPDTVLIPWQGWSLSTHDFLVTRAMEIVVHSDDLASSVGLPTPEFPDAVLGAVLGLLSSVAVDRHGQAAVVRALSRPQRAPASISAF
jgi:hypothetical protein